MFPLTQTLAHQDMAVMLSVPDEIDKFEKRVIGNSKAKLLGESPQRLERRGENSKKQQWPGATPDGTLMLSEIRITQRLRNI
ncbi:hypothetical protein E2320_007200, partial [Naja naja]